MSEKKNKKKSIKDLIITALVAIVVVLIIATIEYFKIDVSSTLNKILVKSGITLNQNNQEKSKNNSNNKNTNKKIYKNISLKNIPEYFGEPYIEINNNKPYFKEYEYTKKAFEKYSELDELGRCGVAFANICKEIMPTSRRESITDVKPSGFKNKSYPGMIEGDYIYNRCHLIAHKLSGENANNKNLITGTRYLNVSGMLPFEDKVAEYMYKHKSNHVLYRVTPIFEGDNLVASGVEMEAYSVEDKGEGICFNIYAYNVQPGININYANGNSYKAK